jgi:hypothetical protein
MNTTYVNVIDSPYIITNIINKVAISIVNVQLFTSVMISAILFHNDKLLDNKTIVLTGEEYDAWGNNDQYIINITLQKLGLHEKPNLTIITNN